MANLSFKAQEMARYLPYDGFAAGLADMRRAEYGSRSEIIIRYAILIVVVVVLALTMDSRIALAWAAIYGAFEAGLALSLVRTDIGHPLLRYATVLVFYVLSAIAFMALPLYLVAADHSISHTFAGAVGMVGLALYTLQKPLREVGFMIADCVLIALMTCAVVVIISRSIDSLLEIFTVSFVTLAVLGYYIGSQVSGWRLQTELRAERKRVATEQKARALDQFVGGVAHEFNNDLTVILGNLDLYETLRDPDERLAAFRSSRTAAERAALMVQHLMAASGRLRLSPTGVDVNSLLLEISESLNEALDPEMTIELLPPTQPMTALVDRSFLRSCMVQLGLNTQEATEGTGFIRIRAERRATSCELVPPAEASGPFIALIFEDDGPGVENHALPLLAEPFFSTKPPNEGRGLGLSAVAGFARQSGGGLTLEHATIGGLRAVLYLVECPQA